MGKRRVPHEAENRLSGRVLCLPHRRVSYAGRWWAHERRKHGDRRDRGEADLLPHRRSNLLSASDNEVTKPKAAPVVDGLAPCGWASIAISGRRDYPLLTRALPGVEC